MAKDLSKIGVREALKVRPGKEPHWQRLSPGVYLGYRPAAGSGAGTWLARVLKAETRKYERKALGSYAEVSGNEVFKQAKTDAEAFAGRVETGSERPKDMKTVADACQAYLEELARNAKPTSIAKGVFRRHVDSDPIAKVELDKLTRQKLRDWRKRLEDAPALITRTKVSKRGKGGEQRTKKRSPSTVNRDMVPLRAALRQVLEPGRPGTDAAWQEALKPIKGAGQRRELYLDRSERQRLLAAASSEIDPFLRALCLLPVRPGALAALTAGDFDERTSVLSIRKDKTGARKVTLRGAHAEFIKEQRKGKHPAAPMFMRASGEHWNKDAYKGPVKEAVKAAGLPGATSAYTLRHSVITDLVRGGLPLLTVAQLAGTGVVMIQKHYGQFVSDDAVAEALARLAI